MTLRQLLTLTKFNISAVSTLSAAAGYRAGGGGADPGLAALVAGTLALAMAASALNEILERDQDARMARTRTRPLPSGAVGVGQAWALALGLAAGGAALLGRCNGPWTCALGLAALAWYVLVYTPLKRHTAFAVVPGSVIGALPPAMGWTAAGRDPLDPANLAMALVFFLWQVPHFWLLTLLHRRDYRPVFPTLERHLPVAGIRRLTFAWICVTAASSFLLPAFGVVVKPVSMVLLAAAGAAWVARSGRLLGGAGQRALYQRTFADLNFYILAVMAALAAG